MAMFYPWVVVLVFTCLLGLLLMCLSSLLFGYKRRESTISMASNLCVEPNGEDVKALSSSKQAHELQIDQEFQGAPWIPGGKPRIHRHPLYNKMSIKNGQVNILPLDKVKESLSTLKLSTR